MQPFTQVESATVPLAEANVDTDQIIPARFLQKPRNGQLGEFLFHDLRRDPAFILNHVRDARILAAAANFGCGSSRENAVWALYDYGFRVVIAPSFGDIFRNNCLKNGLLPVSLPADAVASLMAQSTGITKVDLESQTVTLPDATAHSFPIDPFARHCLLNGMEELDYTLSLMEEIAAFEQCL